LIPVIDRVVWLTASDPAALLAGQTLKVKTLPSPFLFLRTLSRQRARVTFKPSTTLAEIKASITAFAGCRPEAQCLLAPGRRLQVDDRTLADLNVAAGSTVCFVLLDAPPSVAADGDRWGRGAQDAAEVISLRISRSNGKQINVAIAAKATGADLAQVVWRLESVPAHEQRLLYEGRRIEDGRTLARQGIADGSAIDLCLRQVGGMMHASSGRDGYRPIAHPTHPFAIAAKATPALDLTGEAEADKAGASSGGGGGSAAINEVGTSAARSEANSGGATFEQLYGLLEAADEADAAASGRRGLPDVAWRSHIPSTVGKPVPLSRLTSMRPTASGCLATCRRACASYELAAHADIRVLTQLRRLYFENRSFAISALPLVHTHTRLW
jgi:hypothetical protein